MTGRGRYCVTLQPSPVSRASDSPRHFPASLPRDAPIISGFEGFDGSSFRGLPRTRASASTPTSRASGVIPPKRGYSRLTLGMSVAFMGPLLLPLDMDGGSFPFPDNRLRGVRLFERALIAINYRRLSMGVRSGPPWRLVLTACHGNPPDRRRATTAADAPHRRPVPLPGRR